MSNKMTIEEANSILENRKKPSSRIKTYTGNEIIHKLSEFEVQRDF